MLNKIFISDKVSVLLIVSLFLYFTLPTKFKAMDTVFLKNVNKRTIIRLNLANLLTGYYELRSDIERIEKTLKGNVSKDGLDKGMNLLLDKYKISKQAIKQIKTFLENNYGVGGHTYAYTEEIADQFYMSTRDEYDSHTSDKTYRNIHTSVSMILQYFISKKPENYPDPIVFMNRSKENGFHKVPLGTAIIYINEFTDSYLNFFSENKKFIKDPKNGSN